MIPQQKSRTISCLHLAAIPQFSRKFPGNCVQSRKNPQKSAFFRYDPGRYGIHSHLLEISLRAISRGFESLTLRQNFVGSYNNCRLFLLLFIDSDGEISRTFVNLYYTSSFVLPEKVENSGENCAGNGNFLFPSDRILSVFYGSIIRSFPGFPDFPSWLRRSSASRHNPDVRRCSPW